MTMFQDMNRERIIKAMVSAGAYRCDIENVKSGNTCAIKAARSYGIPKYPPIKEFKTHKGDIVKGEMLQDALNHVADFFESNAISIRNSEDYAKHVTESEKNECLKKGLNLSKNIRAGYVESLATSQRLNTYLTGECIALLP